MAYPRLILFTLTCLLAGCSSGTRPTTQRVTISGQDFVLELALDDAARMQGLSDRESIAEDGGMLFVFVDAQPRQFVMRRCLVPIDIIFLGPNGRIVAMHAMMVEPIDTPNDQLKRYSSHWPAQFAIELKGDSLKTLGLEMGQKIELPMEDLKKQAR